MTQSQEETKEDGVQLTITMPKDAAQKLIQAYQTREAKLQLWPLEIISIELLPKENTPT